MSTYPTYITMEELRDIMDDAARHISTCCDFMAEETEEDGRFWQLQPVPFGTMFDALLDSYNCRRELEQEWLRRAREQLARMTA